MLIPFTPSMPRAPLAEETGQAMRLGQLTAHHGFERMRLRGRSRAGDEFQRAAVV